MRVRFWGTRGSIPSPGPETVIYGGNTSCVEVRLRAGGEIILDAGSGIRKLGMALMLEPRVEAALLLTHVHWDHIQGFPFFMPAYRAGNVLDIFGLVVSNRRIEQLLSDQMEQAYFPVDLRSLRASIGFHDLGASEFECHGARVRMLRVNHTTETAGFRIEADGLSCVYIPDNELAHCGEPGKLAYAQFVEFCAGTDLLIHDSQYSEAVYPRYRGWGHSTFERSLRLALDARAKRYALFHYDPQTTDSEVEMRLARCREEVAAARSPLDCFASREGFEVDLAVPAGQRF